MAQSLDCAPGRCACRAIRAAWRPVAPRLIRKATATSGATQGIRCCTALPEPPPVWALSIESGKALGSATWTRLRIRAGDQAEASKKPSLRFSPEVAAQAGRRQGWRAGHWIPPSEPRGTAAQRPDRHDPPPQATLLQPRSGGSQSGRPASAEQTCRFHAPWWPARGPGGLVHS